MDQIKCKIENVTNGVEHRQLPLNFAGPLNCTALFSIFQLIVLVLPPATLLFCFILIALGEHKLNFHCMVPARLDPNQHGGTILFWFSIGNSCGVKALQTTYCSVTCTGSRHFLDTFYHLQREMKWRKVPGTKNESSRVELSRTMQWK